MGLYPYVRFLSSHSIVSVGEDATAIVLDWELPKTVFDSHWAAPWHQIDWDIPIPF
jgi:hypothetical protein